MIILIFQNAFAIEDLKKKLASPEKKRSCLTDLPVARKVYAEEPNNLDALHVIADCTQGQEINHYATGAKDIFENSRILSIVPKLLEIAQVKDLIPILREVEVKKDKALADYLMINEIYERLGEPEKQMKTLKEAIKLDPHDPRPIMILASKQFDADQVKEKEGILKSYLEHGAPHPGRLYLMMYVLALVYPLPLSLLVLGTVWGLALLLRKRKNPNPLSLSEFKLALPMSMALVPPLLALRFWQTSQALPLGALLVVILVQLFFIADPVLSKFYKPTFKYIGKLLYFVFNGTILAKKFAHLSLGSRALVAFVTLTVLGVIAPTFDSPDIKYGIIIVGSLVLYATIGSLMISFMRSRDSLVTTLRWIAITATLPFLVSYIVANWTALGVPFMYGEFPTAKAIDSLVSYLTFWGGSLLLATHLGKIMAEAFIQPIHEVMGKVELIEKGQFDAKVDVYSRDEIGHLGHAINRMGEGLKKREKIEKTFSKYVDKRIAERILDGVETEVRVAGQSVNATVLFCDIRGFTTFSEKSSAEEVVTFLNQFFERIVRIVQEHQGVVDKFIGDNLMAVWGVPSADPEAEIKATRAALAMIVAIENWNEELQTKGLPSIGIGIGLNSGPVVAGSIGSMDRMEYTVIGDTVNTAQRAESIAKKQQLVVTGEMYEKIKPFVEATAMEPIMIKGKSQLQHWWSVTSEVKKQLKAG